MVRIHPDPPEIRCAGAVAQLGERLLCKQEAVGSIPSSSTTCGVALGYHRDGASRCARPGGRAGAGHGRPVDCVA